MKAGLSQKKLKLLFELLEELYYNEQKRSGMSSCLPAVYAKSGPRFLVYSSFGEYSKSLKESVTHWGHHVNG